MALETNELLSSNSRNPEPRIWATSIQVKTFATDAGAALLEVGTPIAFNSSTNLWVVWTNGGANDTGTIRGFVVTKDVQLSAADEVQGNVMMTGDIHYGSIVLPSGEVEANLKAALRVGPRSLGLHIKGLDQVH